MIGEYKEIACPFCGEGRIQCIHVIANSSDFFRSVKNDKQDAVRNETKGFVPNLNLQIHSDCDMCGKTQEDIEKKLRTDSKE